MLFLDRVQLLFQHFYLLSVLSQQCVFRVLINLRLVFDSLGAVGVAQSAESLLVAGARGRNVSNHARFDVAAKRVLEQARQFRVSVGHVLALAVDEGRDHIH